ncbi:MAG: 30S ribosomal protein S16 [Solirubrobacterales bacterium]|nr:30S ribosomal protein S16 [Solirubrobacterales bacterium]
MSVRIRLTRVGSHKNPVWRVVAADQRAPRDGRILETVGQYNAQTEPSSISLDEDRIKDGRAKGAQPTAAVRRLMRIQGIDPNAR